MNLKNLFNFNYLKQNLKKSKATLMFFIGVIPIISSIIFLLIASNTSETGEVISLEMLSIINFIGIYILPFIISLCLFGFTFKRKSVDFINSMPISRKTIFVTNTIGGIAILLLMNLISVLLLIILSLVFNNIFIPWPIFLDYMLIWVTIYIFTFTACNLAMSISGNFITQIVVTALILFLVPFTHQLVTSHNFESSSIQEVNITCTEEACTPVNYSCYANDTVCNINKSLGIYNTQFQKETNITYIAPYNFFYQLLFGNPDLKLYNIVQLIEMIILSIIYFFLGLYLFTKRRMEVCETSFKNDKVHNLVKGLTLIPIWTLGYVITINTSDLFVSLLILTMIIVYYFVYDLITRKSITNIKNIILSFVISSIIIVLGLEINNNRPNNTLNININDINGISIVISNNESISKNNKDIYIENKELINMLIKNYLENMPYKDYYYDYEDYDTEYYSYQAKIKTKNNKILSFGSYLKKSDYNKVLDIISNNKQYSQEFKNINYDKIFALKLGRQIIDIKENKDILKIIETSLKDITVKEYINLNQEDSSYQNYITLYSYDNHEIISYKINNAINNSLKERIILYYNTILKENITNLETTHYLSCDRDICYDYDYSYNDKQLMDFIINNIDDNLDISKEYITISIYTNEDSYYFTTNKIEEFENIITSIGKIYEYNNAYEDIEVGTDKYD